MATKRCRNESDYPVSRPYSLKKKKKTCNICWMCHRGSKTPKETEMQIPSLLLGQSRGALQLSPEEVEKGVGCFHKGNFTSMTVGSCHLCVVYGRSLEGSVLTGFSLHCFKSTSSSWLIQFIFCSFWERRLNMILAFSKNDTNLCSLIKWFHLSLLKS